MQSIIKIQIKAIFIAFLYILFSSQNVFALSVNYNLYEPPSTVLTIWGSNDRALSPLPEPEATPDAPKGGSLRLGLAGTFDNFNPFARRGLMGAYIGFGYESLGESMPGSEIRMQALIAKDFRIAKDRASMLVSLKEEAYFSDGVPITAKDVVYSFNALMKEASPRYRAYYEQVVSVEEVDAHTVLIKFEDGDNRELPLIVCQLPVLPSHWWEGKNLGDPQIEAMPGSGPYQLKDYTMGTRLSLERDKNYWGRDLPQNAGLYNFDTLEVEYFRDTTVSREAFFAGVLDFYLENTIKDWKNAYDVPAVRNGKITRYEKEVHSNRGLGGLFINTRREVLQDKDVRLALRYIYDFEWINRALFYNAYTRYEGVFTGSYLAASPLPTKEELKILEQYKDIFSEKEYQEIIGLLPEIPVTDGSGRSSEGLRKAYYLLEEAGYTLVDGKMVNSKGEQLVLRLMLSSPTLQRVYLPYQRSLARLGIHLEIQLVDQTQYITRLRSYDYDLIHATIPQSNNPGNEQRYTWSSSSVEEKGTRNYAGVNNPVIDDIVEKLIFAENEEQWLVYVRLLDRLIQHGVYVINGYYGPRTNFSWWNERVVPPSKEKEDNTTGINIFTWYTAIHKKEE